MRSFLALGFLFLFSLSVYAQGCDSFASQQAQEKLNESFRNPKESPLKPKDLSRFKGLKFHRIKSKYCVQAQLIRTQNALPFLMKTTTDRLPEYVEFGEVVFNLEGKEHRLKVYQNTQLSKKTEYADYLFLPFQDLTNGKSTYSGGRYLDLRIPESDILVLDFNRAYNPYCAYNEKYSCPIVPQNNYLDIAIKAGVKKFK